MSFLIEFRAPLGVHFRLKIYQNATALIKPSHPWPQLAARGAPGRSRSSKMAPKWLQNGGPRSPRAPKTGRRNSENEPKVAIEKKLT